MARDGFGDMAVSNAIGSNVFDINLGIGLPYLIKSIIERGKPVLLLTPVELVNCFFMTNGYTDQQTGRQRFRRTDNQTEGPRIDRWIDRQKDRWQTDRKKTKRQGSGIQRQHTDDRVEQTT